MAFDRTGTDDLRNVTDMELTGLGCEYKELTRLALCGYGLTDAWNSTAWDPRGHWTGCHGDCEYKGLMAVGTAYIWNWRKRNCEGVELKTIGFEWAWDWRVWSCAHRGLTMMEPWVQGTVMLGLCTRGLKGIGITRARNLCIGKLNEIGIIGKNYRATWAGKTVARVNFPQIFPEFFGRENPYRRGSSIQAQFRHNQGNFYLLALPGEKFTCEKYPKCVENSTFWH